MKCLDITLTPGKTIHIPAYWWYSIKFGKDTSVSCFRYRTYMNNAAITPHIAMYALQIQNIKRDVAKKHDIRNLNKEQPIDNAAINNGTNTEINTDNDNATNINDLQKGTDNTEPVISEYEASTTITHSDI